MLRMLHISDIHINKTFITKVDKKRVKLQMFLEKAFMNAIDYCIEEKLDALLISGDLFDTNTIDYKYRGIVLRGFEKLNSYNIKVYYASGNHDFTDMNSDVRRIKYPENVYTFFDSSPKTYKIETDDGVYSIVGCGHMVEQENRNLIEMFPRADVCVVHSMIHSSLTIGDEGEYLPSDIKTIESKNYKYTALGHIHQNGSINKDNSIYYAGCLQGLNINETGAKGGNLVEMDQSTVTVSFVPLNALSYKKLDYNIVETSFDQLHNALIQYIKENLKTIQYESYSLQITFFGKTGLYNTLKDERKLGDLIEGIAQQLGLFDLRINLNIHPDFDIEHFKNKKNVLSKVLEDVEKARIEGIELTRLSEETIEDLLSDIEEELVSYFMEGKNED